MKRSRTAMIIGLLLTGMTCAHAQKMSISSPSSIETYAKDREYIGVTNEGIQALTGSLTLVLDDATQPISLGTVSVPENSSVRLPLDFPDTKTLRDHLKLST